MKQEIEAQVRTLLTKRGQTHAHLHALHVEGDQIEPFTAYDVDVAGKKLIERL